MGTLTRWQVGNGFGVNSDAVLQLQTDIAAEGKYGERFLVATPQRLVIVSNNGSAKIEREVPMSDLGRRFIVSKKRMNSQNLREPHHFRRDKSSSLR